MDQYILTEVNEKTDWVVEILPAAGHLLGTVLAWESCPFPEVTPSKTGSIVRLPSDTHSFKISYSKEQACWAVVAHTFLISAQEGL